LIPPPAGETVDDGEAKPLLLRELAADSEIVEDILT
jgi:hypothetical protein